MLIDFRVRPPLPSFKGHLIYSSHTEANINADQSKFSVLRRFREESRSAREHSIPLFLDEMEAAGITHGVIMGRDAGDAYGVSSNKEIADFCQKYGDKFRAFAGVSGVNQREALSTIQGARKNGFVGVAFDNGWVGLHQDAEPLWQLYDAAAQDNLIIALTASQLMGVDMSYSNPERLKPVAKRYPELPIVVTHGAWPWTAEVCSLAYENPNIYLMPDCYLNTGAPGTDEYILAANRFMADRLIYASAYPVRPLKQSLDYFKSLPLTESAMRGALSENAQRLLGWPR